MANKKKKILFFPISKMERKTEEEVDISEELKINIGQPSLPQIS